MTEVSPEQLERLREAVRMVDVARSAVMRHASRLYSPETSRERFGTVATAPEVLEAVMGDIRFGRLELRDTTEVCSRWGCTDLQEFLVDADRYYHASGRLARERYRLNRTLLEGV